MQMSAGLNGIKILIRMQNEIAVVAVDCEFSCLNFDSEQPKSETEILLHSQTLNFSKLISVFLSSVELFVSLHYSSRIW